MLILIMIQQFYSLTRHVGKTIGASWYTNNRYAEQLFVVGTVA